MSAPVKVGDKVPCWNCHGTGAEVFTDWEHTRKVAVVCSTCKGTCVVVVEEHP